MSPKKEGSERWVPLHHVFGRGPIPVSAAAVIHRAMERAQKIAGPPPVDRWLLMEWICGDFLAGLDVPSAEDAGDEDPDRDPR